MNLDLIFEPVFSNFIIKSKLELNCTILEEYAYSCKKTQESYNRSNYGGWQGHINERNDFPEELKTLFSLVEKTSKRVSEELLLNDYPKVDNFWININKHKDFNIPHLHPASVFSCVFYIKAPENCGKIVFTNPINAHPFVYNKYTVTKYNLFNSQEWSYGAETNMLLMFPSYLSHYVTPNENLNEDRISIAINLS